MILFRQGIKGCSKPDGYSRGSGIRIFENIGADITGTTGLCLHGWGGGGGGGDNEFIL